MRTFRCVYRNCYRRLMFELISYLLDISTNKSIIFYNFRTPNLGKKHRNQTNNNIFFNNILSSKYLTFIFILGNTQNSFSCGWNSGSFWSAKYLNLGQKLTICAVHHTFLEERHPEDTKNPFFWSPEVSRKFLSFDRLLNILMLKRYH